MKNLLLSIFLCISVVSCQTLVPVKKIPLNENQRKEHQILVHKKLGEDFIFTDRIEANLYAVTVLDIPMLWKYDPEKKETEYLVPDDSE